MKNRENKDDGRITKRVNFTIEPKLHTWAKTETKGSPGGFSAYVTRLIIADKTRSKDEKSAPGKAPESQRPAS